MVDVSGNWRMTVAAPNGERKSMLTLKQDGDSFTGTNNAPEGSSELQDCKIDGDRLSWKMDITKPAPMTVEADVTVKGDTMTGELKTERRSLPLTGTRES